MKARILAIASILFIGLSAKAQYYSFTQSTEPYTELVNAEVEFKDSTAMNSYFKLLGNFRAYNLDLDSELTITRNAYLHNITDYGNVMIMGGVGAKTKQGVSQVSTVVEGTGSTRIFKVQYKNLMHESETGDTLNVQIWIYESTQKIEIRFGSGTSNRTFNCGLVLFAPQNGGVYDYFVLQGNPNNPNINTSGITTISGWPAEGTVYTFNILTTGVQTLSDSAFKVYPNPTTGTFQLEGENIAEVKAYDATGKEVKLSVNANEYQLVEPKKGLYQLQIRTKDGGIRSKRITVH
ncbi:MAG: T9SS type A sorting domain-containing protein [Bacteroidetes bacterium]|nr:MAG: T9SS type A sorting domain-containing protein [Bacteroidota bacterium]